MEQRSGRFSERRAQVDDSDAPDGTWVLYAISRDANGLPEVIQSTGLTSSGAISGSSDFKRLGYGGPCPPGSDTHGYFFKLYALDTRLDLDRGVTTMELIDAMSGHVLAEGAPIRYVSEEVARFRAMGLRRAVYHL